MADVSVERLEERQRAFEQLLKTHNEHDDERFDAMRREMHGLRDGMGRVERKMDDFILKIEKRISHDDATKAQAEKGARITAAKWATGISAGLVAVSQILSMWLGG